MTTAEPVAHTVMCRTVADMFRLSCEAFCHGQCAERTPILAGDPHSEPCS